MNKLISHLEAVSLGHWSQDTRELTMVLGLPLLLMLHTHVLIHAKPPSTWGFYLWVNINSTIQFVGVPSTDLQISAMMSMT